MHRAVPLHGQVSNKPKKRRTQTAPDDDLARRLSLVHTRRGTLGNPRVADAHQRGTAAEGEQR